ncbi:porin family protein [Hymenobacter sp. H14-R3]|uniref:porin family protein n=1 Tax=Hymenobacter sp. H14-R3 TaxID=3046308 RepID=UPI0024BA6C94|nr:porin family protein [Hymenobacter sp. H14-R3]MDJ0365007.1 porin family protein [Hymenobacter sp. H14-R3]
MKRVLFLLSSGLLVASTAHAQFGLRVGGSLSKLHTATSANLYSSSGARLGYQIGVTYQLPLTTWLAVVPEIQYSDERSRLSQASYARQDVALSADSRLSLRYLNVPVLMRATFGPVYVEAGPQASLLLGGRQTGTVTYTGWGISASTRTFDQPATEGNRRFDAGACVGMGVKLAAGLGVSLRAYRGLVTLNQERSNFDGEHQRQSLQASLTYQLPTR